MPNYDYECTSCGLEIEITHSIKDDAKEHHPHLDTFDQDCNGKLKRLIPKKTGFTFAGGSPTAKTYV